MAPTDPSAFARRVIVAAIAVGVVAGAVFLAAPGIDLAVSGLFADDRFAHGASAPVRAVRSLFNLVFLAGCIAAAAGVIGAFVRGKPLLGWPPRRWVHFAACLAVGPGLVANLLFKGQWGRARPIQAEDFGGELIFTPPLLVSDQCVSNCSFVSGEAASIYMLFFALAFAMPGQRTRLMLAGIVLGSIAGAMRIVAGGHFLSDVIFAGVFMALTAALLQLAVERLPAYVRPGGGAGGGGVSGVSPNS